MRVCVTSWGSCLHCKVEGFLLKGRVCGVRRPKQFYLWMLLCSRHQGTVVYCDASCCVPRAAVHMHACRAPNRLWRVHTERAGCLTCVCLTC